MSEQSRPETHRCQVEPEAAGGRLDRFLADALPTLSRMRIKGLIGAGQVRLGEATITEPAYRVKSGEAFTITVPAPADARPEPQAMPLRITHEDADLIVVDKPAGLVVHRAPGNPDHTLVNALLAHCGEALSGIGGVRRPGIVHRIDKDTSGLLVVAKTELAHAALSAAFAAHDIERAYLALVWGRPRPAEGTIRGAIGRDPRNRKKMAVVDRGGKDATTHYRIARRFGQAATLLECRLETGRTHQIRVHLAEAGHAVVADPVYGRARRRRSVALGAELAAVLGGFKRQALHAHVLGFAHPRSGEQISFRSELPTDFSDLIDCFGVGTESNGRP